MSEFKIPKTPEEIDALRKMRDEITAVLSDVTKEYSFAASRKAYRVRDRKTGLYFRKTNFGSGKWSNVGSVWNKSGPLRNSFRWGYLSHEDNRKDRDIEIVEIELVEREVNAIPLEEW